MILTLEKALRMLDEGKELNPGRWIEHSKRVGEAAARIARVIGLDEEKAMIMGYLHDIGKRFGKDIIHQDSGYKYLKKLKVNDEYCNICLTHSYLNGDVNCTAGIFPKISKEDYSFRIDFLKNYQYTVYDKLINLCDLICTNKFVGLEKRLIDIYSRRGVYENTVYHLKEALKLKKEFEEMLGCNLYSLFPEVIENMID